MLLGKDKASAYWEDPNLRHSEASPSKHAHPVDSERLSTQFTGLATLRGAKKPEQFSGWCSTYPEETAGQLHCGAECDRRLGEIKTEDGAHLMFSNPARDLLLAPGEEETEAQSLKNPLSLGADDKNFRLDPRPLSDCVAEANKTNSAYASLGAPLRERLKTDARFCFGRDYSAQHLASHPKQITATIRVSRSAGEIAADRARGLLADWPDGARVSVSVTTRKEGRTAALTYVCEPADDQWECTAALCKAGKKECSAEERENTRATGCDKDEARTIYLRRGQKDFMMLGNANIGLPLHGFSGQSGKTTKDDRNYRLELMSLAACAAR